MTMKAFKDDLFNISNVPFWAFKLIAFVALSVLFYRLIIADPGNTVASSIILAIMGGYTITAIIFVVGACIRQAFPLRSKRIWLAPKKPAPAITPTRWYYPVSKTSRINTAR